MESRELLGRELVKEYLLSESRISRILATVFNRSHSSDKEFLTDIQRVAEVECVKVLNLRHHNHNVVCRLIINQHVTVAVAYCSSRWVQHPVLKGVAVGMLLVFVAHNLKEEKAHNVCDHDEQCHRNHHELSFFQIIIAASSHLLFANAASIAKISAQVNTTLAMQLVSIPLQSLNENASTRK